VIDFWQLLALLSPAASLGAEAVPPEMTTLLPSCDINQAQFAIVPGSLR